MSETPAAVTTTVFPTEYSGELDVALEGSPIEYPAPYTSWCSHHFTVLDPLPGRVLSRANAVPGPAPRVIVRTLSDTLAGCKVQIVIQHPPEIIGKDQNGNLLIKEVPDEPIAGHIAYLAAGV